MNAVAWSFISPPFQVPDEPEHVAYVRDLAINGTLPQHGGQPSTEEELALELTGLQRVAEQPEMQTISSRAQQKRLHEALERAKSLPNRGNDFAGVAASEPPLYYALEVLPYSLGVGDTLLGRVQLMRLFSSLFGGLTALFTFMFIREALPRVPWAWTVGGTSVALAPLLGLMSGAVNPDSMLYAVTAALFCFLARGFRRGLTRSGAVTLGTLIAIGFATKLNFVGIAPGAVLGLLVLSVRAARTLGRAAYFSLGMALAIAVSPILVYVLGHVVAGKAPLGIVSSASAGTQGSLTSELSYIWQLYLPRLPGMHDDFPGAFTTKQMWFNGYVGLYGWLDTPFPGWVYELALVPAVAIAGLCTRAALASAGELRARVGELVVYVAMGVGLMMLVGADSYIQFPKVDAEFAQLRYMLPLLPLLGIVLSLAARGAGARWGPVVGAVIVALFLGHDIFSQLQEVARFYG